MNAGAFDRYAKTELVEGDIWTVTALCSCHARIYTLRIRLLGRVDHQLWKPAGAAFANVRQIPFGEPTTDETIDGITIATTSL